VNTLLNSLCLMLFLGILLSWLFVELPNVIEVCGRAVLFIGKILVTVQWLVPLAWMCFLVLWHFLDLFYDFMMLASGRPLTACRLKHSWHCTLYKMLYCSQCSGIWRCNYLFSCYWNSQAKTQVSTCHDIRSCFISWTSTYFLMKD